MVMTRVAIRDATSSDLPAICALNRSEVEYTSELDLDRLIELERLACYHKVAYVDGNVAGFLLAMDSDAAYVNVNFQWFSKKYPRYLYIDRIVVSKESRGLSLGSALYRNLFEFANNNNYAVVTCEYNIVPPNEPSRVFHNKFGFREQGTQWLANGSKCVSLQAAECPSRINDRKV